MEDPPRQQPRQTENTKGEHPKKYTHLREVTELRASALDGLIPSEGKRVKDGRAGEGLKMFSHRRRLAGRKKSEVLLRDLGGKSTRCSSQGPKFDPQHLHGGSG